MPTHIIQLHLKTIAIRTGPRLKCLSLRLLIIFTWNCFEIFKIFKKFVLYRLKGKSDHNLVKPSTNQLILLIPLIYWQVTSAHTRPWSVWNNSGVQTEWEPPRKTSVVLTSLLMLVQWVWGIFVFVSVVQTEWEHLRIGFLVSWQAVKPADACKERESKTLRRNGSVIGCRSLCGTCSGSADNLVTQVCWHTPSCTSCTPFTCARGAGVLGL